MAKENVNADKRKYIRVDEEDLLICEPFDGATFGGVTSKRKHVFTKSISEGGILFEADEPFEIGSLLKLQLDLPGWEKYKKEFYRNDAASGRHPLVVLGKVVRIEDVGKGSFDIGVIFTAVDSGHKQALKTYIAQRMKKA